MNDICEKVFHIPNESWVCIYVGRLIKRHYVNPDVLEGNIDIGPRARRWNPDIGRLEDGAEP